VGTLPTYSNVRKLRKNTVSLHLANFINYRGREKRKGKEGEGEGEGKVRKLRKNTVSLHLVMLNIHYRITFHRQSDF